METGRAVRTTCPYCGVGCGVLATLRPDGVVDIAGDPEHPANYGRLCSKGSALGETLGLADRVLRPEVEGRQVDWEAALDHVAARFTQSIAEHGPDSVAFYVSGQLLTEDYYVANKLMKGFIGTANIDTNSRLCMSSSVAGHIRAFGSDTVPGTYEDLEEADLVVLVGSNLAWCHPVLFQRLMAARERRGTRLVVVDPRRTVTAEAADLHLPLAPDSDVALFLGLLDHLDSTGVRDEAFIGRHTSGLDEALSEARACGFDGALEVTELAAADLQAFYAEWAGTERVVTVFSQGVNQSTSGTDKVNAIINCHLISARIGRPGMGPFSVTGQPNAMGGREVGGLATMLAAHLEIGNPEHRRLLRDVWASPRIPDRTGLKAVDLFRAVGDGRVRALWIISTNPADSMPEADIVQAALASCPFVVVSDIVRTDTSRHAHVILPAAAWGEKRGTVTNSERRISLQRPFLPVPGEARPDWWIICEVARRMGYRKAFAFASTVDIFREFAALSATGNEGSRDFDIGAHAEITPDAYESLTPFQWPQRAGHAPNRADGRFFGDGRFFTADRRARFVPTPPVRRDEAVPAYPLTLNTGRVRDHWHTMTRTGKSPRLGGHVAEPFCEIHPADAAKAGIAPDALVQIVNSRGRMVARAMITQAQRPGSIFAPMHWTDQVSAEGRVDVLTGSTVDPVSGQPALKSAAVRIEPFKAGWHGFAVLRNRPTAIEADYWALARIDGGWRIEFAGRDEPKDWTSTAAHLLGVPERDLIAYRDVSRGDRRFAAYAAHGLTGCLFVSRKPVKVSRDWLAGGVGQSSTAMPEQLRILRGRPSSAQPDPGPLVCACFGVGANIIIGAILRGARTIEGVGTAVRAGTNCGSCRSEVGRLIDGQTQISKVATP